MMLETWCWMESVLKDISYHYTHLRPDYLTAWKAANPGMPDPPQKIPDDLLRNLVRTKHFNRAYWFLDQM
jgi:metallopeptidase MepB